MSSDTFRYRIDEVEGRDVALTIRPTTAGGLCDLASSRSFVLMLLREQGGPVTFEQTMDTGWLAEHLDEYITRVTPERLVGCRYESTLRSTATDWEIPAEHLQPRLTVRATMASEALAACFVAGESDATTAFDVWSSDPKDVPLKALASEDAPPFDPQPDFEKRILGALRERLAGWQWSDLEGLSKAGADATLRVRITAGRTVPRSAAEVGVELHVPAFEKLPRPARALYGRTFLVGGALHDRSLSPYWFRRFATDTGTPELVYFAADAPMESFEAMIDRLALALSPPDLDALLARDGLRGLVEQGLPALPRKKDQPAVTPLGAWAAPALSPAWRWAWKHGRRWRPEPLWNRVALHAVFGSREEARAALAQARALSKQPPAVLRPLFVSLDAP